MYLYGHEHGILLKGRLNTLVSVFHGFGGASQIWRRLFANSALSMLHKILIILMDDQSIASLSWSPAWRPCFSLAHIFD